MFIVISRKQREELVAVEVDVANSKFDCLPSCELPEAAFRKPLGRLRELSYYFVAHKPLRISFILALTVASAASSAWQALIKSNI